tara:strand:- start:3191 stop:3718 length:528 start_codon:yes stop_codon:yes gene_type:complete
MNVCNNVTYKKYFIHIQKNKILPVFNKFSDMLNDEEFKQNVVEEIIGEFSSTGFIVFFSIVGGGIAVTIHPVAGSIILIMSIVYGSFVKVFCGRYYREKRSRKKIQVERISTQKKIEDGILNVFKKWGSNSSMKYFRTNTAKYGFIRLTSRITSKKRKVFPDNDKKIVINEENSS